eukprot:gene2758-3758_t
MGWLGRSSSRSSCCIDRTYTVIVVSVVCHTIIWLTCDLLSALLSVLVPVAVTAIVKELQTQLLSATSGQHPLHVYTNAKIALETTLLQRMNRLSPAEFEQVLHPVFQEDELTLIIAGGVLGMIAGGIQLGVNILIDNNNNRKERLQKEREKETTMEKELLQPPAVTQDDANKTEFFKEDSAASTEGNDFAVDTDT